MTACDQGYSVSIIGDKAGPSPFIRFLSLNGTGIPKLAAVEYIIAPKPGSVSKPVDVTYTMGSLTARGYVSSTDALTLPVFGLYAGYVNQVTVVLHYQGGSTQSVSAPLTTASFADPVGGGIYVYPQVIVKRAANSTLGFDFFAMKSALGSPVVVDTDAEVRWVAPGVADATSTAVEGDEFVIGDALTPVVHRMRLDGTTADSPLSNPTYLFFHHNIDHGATGFLAEVNMLSNGVTNIFSTITEITDQGSVLNQWDLAAIISNYMMAHGDDAAAFVRPGTDWFHSNASYYDSSDDTLLVSSRENFVIKLDYHTGNILWIFGDPTKYWYTFPSLRAKALTLAAGGLYPIGQHAISISAEGLLMLFNDGYPSIQQPPGAPVGQARPYSAVSAYSINAASMTADNVWNFDYGQSIYAPICSSAYEASGESLLVDYATADDETRARLVGLNASHDVVFDFEYSSHTCDTSWNAVPIPFDSMTIDD